MSEQREIEEQERLDVHGEEERGAEPADTDEKTDASLHQESNAADEPLGEDRELGIDEQVHKVVFLTTGKGVEEAISQADIPEDSEQNGESPKKTAYVGHSTATVKIVLMPEGHVMTTAFAIGLSIKELKQHFASELKVPAEVLRITLDGSEVEEQRTLMDLGVQPHGTIQLEMSSKDPVNHPVRPVKPQQEYNMPDVITVRVHTDAELQVFQEVVVEIEWATQQKAFLGGYRHKVTGTEYHHAAVQTVPKRRPNRGVAVFSRDTQTVDVKSQAQQCSNSTSTQMTKIGCFVSCIEDKLVAPGNYVTAALYHSRRLQAVITLQTYVRRWQAKGLTEQLRRDRDRRLAWMEMVERRKREEKEERIKELHDRRMNPRSKEDFALLYNALEKWRREEMERIDSTLCGAERRAALCALLEQETQFIASIGRHRIVAGQKNYDKVVQAFLDKCAAPKRWKAFDGKVTEMDTPHTIRAKELRDLYNSISLSCSSQEERLDVLITLKHTVMEHDCKLTRDIVELIDREADLMTRGVKKRNLEGLRGRISDLFLQYIKTPTFNPEVAKLLKVPQNPSQLRKNMHFCRGCRRYLQSTDFSLKANARVVGQCRNCAELNNKACAREDLSHHQSLLKRLRQDEEKFSKEAKITYLLQEKDVRYLVDVVWGAQSALGACRDLHDLVMVRWDRLLDWSPWNCILLTKEEASAHLRVNDVHEAYGVAFIGTVKHKHMLAKKYFAQIPAMAHYLHNVESQPAAIGNQLVSKPIAMATGKLPTSNTLSSAHKGELSL